MLGRRSILAMMPMTAGSVNAGKRIDTMPSPVIAPNFDPRQRATLGITMSCLEWDELRMTLAQMDGDVFQSTANAIEKGLIKVGYFTSHDRLQ